MTVLPVSYNATVSIFFFYHLLSEFGTDLLSTCSFYCCYRSTVAAISPSPKCSVMHLLLLLQMLILLQLFLLLQLLLPFPPPPSVQWPMSTNCCHHKYLPVVTAQPTPHLTVIIKYTLFTIIFNAS